MMERTSRKIPVTERQFLWVQDDDKGEVTLHVGPTMVSPTAADRVVVDDGAGGFKEDPSGRPQMMIEVGDHQYAVLWNPLAESEGGVNGKFRPGRNEARVLKNGTRAMIPGPCNFWLRPGQRVEVRDAHELASDQYLVVKVYGEVDATAPFFDLTARSAAITRSTAEHVGSDKSSSTPLSAMPQATLTRGQLIVIRGLDTQFYIPPTGVDIVPDTSVDPSGLALTAEAAQQLLKSLPAEAPAAAAVAQAIVAREDVYAEQAEYQQGVARKELTDQASVDQSARARHRKPVPPMAQAPASAPPMGGRAQAPELALPPELLASPEVRRAIEQKAKQSRLVRRAVVLGEKEYCVIIDADGKREIKVGPARVFPGPYDQFMVKGSRHRIYDAYELLPTRGLWLRVIARISRDELLAKLPRGVQLEKEVYHPGDELLLSGVSTFFFPFNEIEVLSPETGQALVGNDHSRVFIEAIGIDQKSGIYVRDLATGEVRLVRGKQSYLVDPRKEVQITRTVPVDDWNLWITAQEPHKRSGYPVTTPWALSINVPHNTAILVASADGQRVVEGPCVTLLGYEERLTPILLSTGTPKSDDAPLRTCYLRTHANRVSDVITIETKDFVSVSLRVSYSVTFSKELRDRWFNHENYVQMMCEHLRSLVRSRCRASAVAELWPQLPAVVRDTILGEKPAEGARPGRLFAENGAHVTEVEVLTATIDDEQIAQLMHRVQTEQVTLQIGDRQAQERLASARLRDEVMRQEAELRAGQKQRDAELGALERRLAHEAQLAQARDEEARALERQTLTEARQAALQKEQLERKRLASDADLAIVQRDAEARASAYRMRSEVAVERQRRLTELEASLIAAQSAATVAERQAVQQGLIEAMTALGDKALLAEAASNMNLVSLFKGKDVATLLGEVLGGTKVMPTIKALVEKYGHLEAPEDDGATGSKRGR